MNIINYKDVEPDGPRRWLIKGPSFDMLIVELEPSRGPPHSPHFHPWEHETFIMEGNGAVWNGEEKKFFKEGDALFIPAGEPHTIINTGERKIRFITCIPAGADFSKINFLSK